ncbi:hypothetical protein ACO03V_06040 [Microbacterium sp. HMH0099]|uniref:hypothetical protein n=1 Tax=Microbacterium sp. HMH0099 TaxID=3414026 RepID=UPI003BF624A5
MVGERLEQPDYNKLARALLEHAAMQARATTAETDDETKSPPAETVEDEEARS